MYFKQILDERCGCASYLVASRQSHVHADHVSGARKLRADHGADLCLHESAQVAYPFRPLKDGEELALGQLRLRVLYTPGHRQELISVLIINPPRSPEPSMVLTGDSLLVGDVGRPDFGGGDAAVQYDSVTRLLRLPAT
jgi:glyoxylase-like metal-dependent hydrolase (beta-lactamase superfamily II)